MTTPTGVTPRPAPILLYDGGCETCTRIADWVRRSAGAKQGDPPIIVRPVGNDPDELRRLNPALDIWTAYEVVHVIMPNGSMKLGGEAVAEVLRCLPGTKLFASCFDISIFGIRPCQKILNLFYHILDDIRPILGCESCGLSKPWVRSIEWLKKWVNTLVGKGAKPGAPLHFMPLPVTQKHVVGESRRPVDTRTTKVRSLKGEQNDDKRQ